ncbi:MAG: hypothetical protein LBN29_03025 [Mediterranea sp.]|jgi:hypothetical protein|nr:hypothetical protein [Mediterranea sp.]
MKVEEPMGIYYSQEEIRNVKRQLIKSIKEEDNLDVLKQHMRLQSKEEVPDHHLSRKKRREMFDRTMLIGVIDEATPWEEMKDKFLKEKYGLK